MGQIMTAEEIRKLYEEIAVQEEKEKEIQALNEEIFEGERMQAFHCSNRHNISHYTCDGCSIITACCSLS